MAWRGTMRTTRHGQESPVARQKTWDGSDAACLQRALAEAQRAGVTHAGAVHLLAGVLDGDTAAARLLRRAGIDPAAVVADAQAHPDSRVDARPFAPILVDLEQTGCLTSRSWTGRTLQRFNRRWSQRLRGGGLLRGLEIEMARLAVRADHREVTAEHALLSVLSMDRQLGLRDATLIADHAPFNTGGDILRQAGLDFDHARACLTAALDPALKRGGGEIYSGEPPVTSTLTASIERSLRIAGDHGHSDVGTLHLLAGLLQEPSLTDNLRRRLSIDVEAIRAEVDEALATV